MMAMTGWRLLGAAIAVALIQIAFLGWVIVGRASILQNGTEILLKTEPIDPRDLLRGDYVRLGTSITSIPTNSITDINGRLYTEGGPIYALLKKGPDGFWTLASATFAKPEMYESPTEAVIRGEVPGGWSLGADSSITADYGIDRFYVPEGEGLQIEQDMRTRTFSILIAVDKNSGEAQIKALLDGDKALYEEPPY
jgi:uncharacterized membrane-anchored protein